MGDAPRGEQVLQSGARQQPLPRRHDQGGARQPRHAHLGDRRVEARRGELEHPALPRHREPLGLRGGQRGEAGVGDHDALRRARRAGGVDHVRRVVRAQAGDGVGVRIRRQVRQVPAQRRGVQDEGGRGVRQDEGAPLGGIVRVHGYVGAARLQDGEQRDRQLRRARQHHGHQRLRAHALAGQPVGEAVGAGVQLTVGERDVLEDQRRGVRRTGRLLREQLGQGAVPDRRTGCRRVPPQPPVLLGGQHVEVGERHVRCGDGRLQDADELGGERGDRGAVEEVGAELDEAVQAARFALRALALPQAEEEVVLGGAGADQLGTGADAEPVEAALGGILHGGDHLEQGLPARRPYRVEGFHQLFEGQVLVGPGGEVGVADAAQQVAEGGVAGGVRPQHEGVDEEAHQVVQGLVGAARDGAAQGDVGTGAQVGEEGGEAGLDDHVEAGAGVAGQAVQSLVEVGGEADREHVAAVGGDVRAGAVEREGDFGGEAGELAAPEGQLAVVRAVGVGRVAEEVLLPQGVVGVLDGERRPLRVLAGAARVVGGGEVAGEGGHGPAVARDVVQEQEEDVVGGAGREEGGAQGVFGGDVEAVAGGFVQGGGQVAGLHLDGGQQVAAGVGRQDDLLGGAGAAGEDGAQALVPGDEVAEGGP